MIPKLLLIPILTGVMTQLAKLIWQTAGSGSFSWRNLHFYGGMPSAHTAIAASLVTVVGLQEGLSSPAFAIAAVFGILVIRDAIGFRRYIGGHSRALNLIVRHLPKDDQRKFDGYREHLGHTPLEAFVGAVIGFSLSAVLYLAFSA